MKTEDISEALNNEVDRRRQIRNTNIKSTFIIQRNIEMNPLFKAYKKYSVLLWYVQDRKKYRILTIEKMERVLDKDDMIIKAINVELLGKLFEFQTTKEWEYLIDGEYGKHYNE